MFLGAAFETDGFVAGDSELQADLRDTSVMPRELAVLGGDTLLRRFIAAVYPTENTADDRECQGLRIECGSEAFPSDGYGPLLLIFLSEPLS